MAYGTRYTMKFTDVLNGDWEVNFGLLNYTGEATTIIGADSPLTIRYDGDEDDLHDTIRSSKATISLVVKQEYSDAFFSDTDNITDKEVRITVTCNRGYTWDGWLIADERKKRMRKENYYLELTAVDNFSLIKGQTFTADDGSILLGRKDMMSILNFAFKKSLSDPSDWKWRITHTLNYTGSSSTGIVANFNDPLHQVMAYSENFRSTNDRPDTGESVVKKIMQIFGMYAFRSQGVFNFRSPIALTPDNIRTNANAGVLNPDPIIRNVHTKEYSDDRPYLLGNSEIITNDRPKKEVSLHFKYDDIISIIENSDFTNWDGTNFSGWINHMGAGNPISRSGTGRPQNPYALHIGGYITTVSPLMGLSGMEGHSYRNIEKGNVLNIKIKFKWYDYVARIPGFPTNIHASFDFRIRVTNGASTYYYYNVSSSDPAADPGQVQRANNWLPMPDFTANPGQWCTCIIASTDAIQTVSFTTPPVPIDGQIKIELMPILIRPDLYPAWNQVNAFIDIINVDFGIQQNSDGNKLIGEWHYLQQAGDYSQIDDMVEVDMGDTRVDTVSGALFKAESPGELTTTWFNSVGAVNGWGLLRNLLRMWMYFGRRPKKKIQVEIFSNELYFEHILTFTSGQQELIPGKFMQMTDEYDVKKCTHSIVAMQLKGSFSDQEYGGSDIYEFYNETNG